MDPSVHWGLLQGEVTPLPWPSSCLVQHLSYKSWDLEYFQWQWFCDVSNTCNFFLKFLDLEKFQKFWFFWNLHFNPKRLKKTIKNEIYNYYHDFSYFWPPLAPLKPKKKMKFFRFFQIFSISNKNVRNSNKDKNLELLLWFYPFLTPWSPKKWKVKKC